MRNAMLPLVLFLLAADLQAQEAAPPDTFSVDWTTTLQALQGQYGVPLGATFVAACPPGGSVTGTIWGPTPTRPIPRSAWPPRTLAG